MGLFLIGCGIVLFALTLGLGAMAIALHRLVKTDGLTPVLFFIAYVGAAVSLWGIFITAWKEIM